MIERVDASPPRDLSTALGEFERSFRYPLGPQRFFRISHGDDYHAFFRAIGRAACFIALDASAVIGSIAVVIRRLGLPDARERRVAYVADLKVAAGPRAGRTLVRLARAADAWARDKTDVAFGVVMDGTRAAPSQYTGRVGIAKFEAIGKVMILRLSTDGAGTVPGDGVEAATAMAGASLYERLSRGRYSSPGGEASVRSLMPATWLIARHESACGVLEDTRRAKRLWDDQDGELVSAHLSSFAYRSVAAGAALVREALRRAAGLTCPALFVSVASADAEAFVAALAGITVVLAPATVYGHGLDAGPAWNVNTAEI